MSAVEIDCALFASLGEDERGLLANVCIPRRVAAGERIVRRGDHLKDLYVVKSGLFAVRVTGRSGVAHEVSRLGRGDCFGEISLLSGEPASATVVAIRDSEVAVLSRSHFLSLARRNPSIFENLAQVVVERLRATNERLLGPAAAERIAVLASHVEPTPTTFGIELACALARFTRARVLFIASSGQTPSWATGDRVTAPSLFETFHDRSLLGRYEEPPDPANGLAGARVAQLVGSGGKRLAARQLRAVLGELSQRCDYLVAEAEGRGAVADVLADSAQVALLILREEAVGQEESILDAIGLKGTNARVQIVALGASSSPTPLARVQDLQARTRFPIRAIIPMPSEPCAEGPLVLAQPDSVASQAIGRLARDMAGLSVGLALGVGGSRGYAHLGVIGVLEREHVPIDCLAGCSIGGAVATAYAGGLPLRQIKEHIENVARKAMRPNLPLFSLFSSGGVIGELKRLAGQTRFEDLSTPLGLVVVDVLRREEVILQRGVLWKAMAASMALPGIYPPVRIGRRLLVDGGIINPIPISAAASLGANIVISAKLANPPKVKRSLAPWPVLDRPLVFDTIARCLEIMQSKIVEDSAAQADVTIEPRFTEVMGAGLRDFHRADEFVEAGERAAEEALPRLRSAMPWLS